MPLTVVVSAINGNAANDMIHNSNPFDTLHRDFILISPKPLKHVYDLLDTPFDDFWYDPETVI